MFTGSWFFTAVGSSVWDREDICFCVQWFDGAVEDDDGDDDRNGKF